MTKSRQFYELLSSMRFAISLLTILSIASIIGTVIKQNDAFNAYLNQFGPFWFPLFEMLGLFNVYNCVWFIAILAFLVLSTSVCISRQTPGMLREMRSYKQNVRESSLRAFKHRASFQMAVPPTAETLTKAQYYLHHTGFKTRVDERHDGTLIAARQGSHSRWGYLLTHSAIVIICLGGLLDGNLPLTAKLALENKTISPGSAFVKDIPASSRLDRNTWSYRANIFIPEGQVADFGIINHKNGVLIQDLPFTVALKKFHIDHYSTGMPKRFASDLIITDKASGKSFSKTLEVNKPIEVDGITLYQSSFEDGGSQLKLESFSMHPGQEKPQPLTAAVGEALPLTAAGQTYQLELTAFRPFNVENLGTDKERTGLERFAGQFGSAAVTSSNKDLRNVGPSFSFKLRDNAGQAVEFQNYMQPILQDGRWMILSGVRDSSAANFRFMRLPLDVDGKLETWFAIQARLLDPAGRLEIADNYANNAENLGSLDKQSRQKLALTAKQTLAMFADKGYETIGRFIEQAVPEAERPRAAEVFLKILQGLVWEAWMETRQAEGLPRLPSDDKYAFYVRDTMDSLSDARFYPAPVFLQLRQFNQVQASVLQATRSPGKLWVFLGSLLLVLGVFSMLYIRERRLFVLMKKNGEIILGLSSNRQTYDLDSQLVRHRDELQSLLQDF